jgi:adenine-specific DNA glycosylase
LRDVGARHDIGALRDVGARRDIGALRDVGARRALPLPVENIEPVFFKEIRHKLTHQHLVIRFYLVDGFRDDRDNGDRRVVNICDLEKYPFPKPLNKIIELTL